MGFEDERGLVGGGQGWGRGVRSLLRRKQVDSDRARAEAGGSHHHQLAKELSIPQLVAIGKLPIYYCFTKNSHCSYPSLISSSLPSLWRWGCGIRFPSEKRISILSIVLLFRLPFCLW